MARKKLLVRKKGYKRKAYTAKRKGRKYKVKATRVKPTRFKIKDRGAIGRGKKRVPKLKEGMLKKKGYSLLKTATARRRALAKDVKARNYKKTKGSVWALVQFFKRTSPSKSKKARTDFNWLVKKYGKKK